MSAGVTSYLGLRGSRHCGRNASHIKRGQSVRNKGGLGWARGEERVLRSRDNGGASTHREGLADGLEEELLGQRVPELAGHRTCDPVPGREGLLPPPRPAYVEHGPSPVVRHLLENEAEDETVVARAGPHQIARQRVPRPLGHRHAAAPAHLTSCYLSQVPLPLLWPAVETTDKRHKLAANQACLLDRLTGS